MQCIVHTKYSYMLNKDFNPLPGCETTAGKLGVTISEGNTLER